MTQLLLLSDGGEAKFGPPVVRNLRKKSASLEADLVSALLRYKIAVSFDNKT